MRHQFSPMDPQPVGGKPGRAPKPIYGPFDLDKPTQRTLSCDPYTYAVCSHDPRTGALRLLNIGSATGANGWRQRMGQRIGIPERYLSREEKRAIAEGLGLKIFGMPATSKADALYTEAVLINLLRPPGNKIPKIPEVRPD